jgi:glutamate/tyrosine decarboxylase-like PLP-dependent enzyme
MHQSTDLEQDLLFASQLSAKQKDFIYSIVETGLGFLEGDQRGDTFLRYAPLDDLKVLVSEELPQNGMPLPDLLRHFREVVCRYSISQSSPRYWAFPDTADSVAGLAGSILSSFLNQNLIAVDRSAPIASVIEIQLIQWLRDLVGFETKVITSPEYSLSDVGGVWASGGNQANCVAVMAAMINRFPEIAIGGLRSCEKSPALVLARGIEHFSFANAARNVGLGERAITWADTLPDFRTDPKSIEKILAECPHDKEYFAVVAVAGNCRTTTVDDLSEIGRICRKYGVWFHVDACHGGSLLFSDKYRKILGGIELADSVSLDPHKGLFTNYPSSFALFRRPGVLSRFSRYPEAVTDPACLDLGLISPFLGSRGFDSLKLWSLIKHAGRAGLSNLIERRQSLNLRLTRTLVETQLFTPLNDNSFYRQAFVLLDANQRSDIARLVVEKPELVSTISESISRNTKGFVEQLYRSGDVCFDSFALTDFGNAIGLGARTKYSAAAMALGHVDIPEDIEESIWTQVRAVGSAWSERLTHEIAFISASTHRPEEASVLSSPASW